MVEDVAECGTVVEDGAECGNRTTVNIIVIVHHHNNATHAHKCIINKRGQID